MAELPYFSIIIPTYNRGHLLLKTIESVLTQEYKDFEVLIVDDGSTDNTEEIVRTVSDKRVTYFKKENGERGAARNFGFGKSKGVYVNFFDSDDLMYPNHLVAAKAMIESNSQPEWFHLGYDFKLPDGTITKRVDDFTDLTSDEILFDNKLSCNGVFVHREILKLFPFVEDRTLASSEDWELWIRLVCRFKLHYSNEITSTVVNHDQRSIRTISPDKVVARDLIFIEKLKDDPQVLKWYGDRFSKFVADRFTYFMLCYSEQRNSSAMWGWAVKAMKIRPSIIGNNRFLASIKNILLR